MWILESHSWCKYGSGPKEKVFKIEGDFDKLRKVCRLGYV